MASEHAADTRASSEYTCGSNPQSGRTASECALLTCSTKAFSRSRSKVASSHSKCQLHPANAQCFGGKSTASLSSNACGSGAIPVSGSPGTVGCSRKWPASVRSSRSRATRGSGDSMDAIHLTRKQPSEGSAATSTTSSGKQTSGNSG